MRCLTLGELPEPCCIHPGSYFAFSMQQGTWWPGQAQHDLFVAGKQSLQWFCKEGTLKPFPVSLWWVGRWSTLFQASPPSSWLYLIPIHPSVYDFSFLPSCKGTSPPPLRFVFLPHFYIHCRYPMHSLGESLVRSLSSSRSLTLFPSEADFDFISSKSSQ